MSDFDSDDFDDVLSPEDQLIERAILGLAIAVHPETLPVEHLVAEIAGEATSAQATQVVHDAINRLTTTGLLHAYGGRVGATKAAARFDRLGI